MRDSIDGHCARSIVRRVRWRHIDDQDRATCRIGVATRAFKKVAHYITGWQSNIPREKDLLTGSYHWKVLEGAEPIASIYSCVSQSGADGIIVAQVLSPRAQTFRPQAQAQAVIDVSLRCKRRGQ